VDIKFCSILNKSKRYVINLYEINNLKMK